MAEIHLGVVRVGDRWTIIGTALRMRTFDTQAEAEGVARRFAGEVIGRPVMISLQEEDGVLHPPQRVEGTASFSEMQLQA